MPKRKKKRKNCSARRLLILLICMLILVLVGIIAVACTMLPPGPDTPPDTIPSTDPTHTDPPTEPPRNGWIIADGNSYYYDNDTALTGAQTIDGTLYCFGEDGALLGSGWQTVGGETYYLNADGTAYYGWLDLEDDRYYLQEDGTMATGAVVIAEQTWFFTSKGCQFYVVNPWHYVPEDYVKNLVDIPSEFGSGQRVDASCYDALMQMLTDCEKAGHNMYILSSNRSQADQEYLFNNQVNKQMANGYSYEEALKVAATISAIPGTSEHQLGLAVDIIDTKLWALEEEQADLPGQQWLMEHCHEYGFILRYPKDGTDSTGIIYEPWHYRYVGIELAYELHELDLTVEEYLETLS